MKLLSYAAWVSKTPARQFMTAVELLVIVIFLRWVVSPWLGDHHELLPGYVAVAAATWLATWRAGLLVAGASLAVLQSPLFLAADMNRLPAYMHEAVSLLAFLFVAGLLIYLTHLASRRLHALTDEVSRLDDADHKKSDFLALIAHELRNPLSTISMGGDMIRSGRLDQRAQEGTWETMERQTEHMKRLISELLDVARIEQGKIQIARETISVRTLVEQAIKDTYSSTHHRQQVVTLRAGADAGHAYVDTLRIGQVLGNLLHNASKFSPAGAPINVTVKTTSQEVQIAVRDSGIGIPRSELNSIFESFVQLEPHSGHAQGLGLGLTLCAKLLQMHEGSIEARSDGVGTGAEFIVRFPRRLPEPVLQPEEQTESGANPQRVAHALGDAPLRLRVVPTP